MYEKALRLCVWNIDDHREDLTAHHENEKPMKVNGSPRRRKMEGREFQSAQNKSDFSTDMGTITNLMSEDAYNVMSFFWIGHYVWAIPLKVVAYFTSRSLMQFPINARDIKYLEGQIYV